MPDYHSIYKILNTKTLVADKLHDIFEIHYIELEKFKKDYAKLKTALDRWLSFLNTAHKIDKNKIPKELKEDEAVTKAIDEVDRMFNEEEREEYKAHLKYKISEQNRVASADAEGEKRGVKKGKIEMATKMLNNGFDVDVISDMSGLNKNEILNIKY